MPSANVNIFFVVDLDEGLSKVGHLSGYCTSSSQTNVWVALIEYAVKSIVNGIAWSHML